MYTYIDARQAQSSERSALRADPLLSQLVSEMIAWCANTFIFGPGVCHGLRAGVNPAANLPDLVA